jgi:hypothetical protein
VVTNKPKSFRTYARSRRAADVVGAEFITYAKSDPHFPDAKTWGDLRTYLNGRGAAHETVRWADWNSSSSPQSLSQLPGKCKWLIQE